jgi:hypothetical protein
MKLEMRQKLAREPFEEKIRKIGQLIRLAKTFPRRISRPSAARRTNTPDPQGAGGKS